MDIKWVDGASIKVRRDGDAVVIAANREGLLSLAVQMIELAKEAQKGHYHLDEFNGLEEHSLELIVERID